MFWESFKYSFHRLMDLLATENSLRAEMKHLERTITELEATNQVWDGKMRPIWQSFVMSVTYHAWYI